ncbi:MAG: zinc ribbon domain-containing protein [Candidatus Thorarchaeota archaeon]|nr:MAG: zinc ribbon domain-containing protein [Candidatus Thorarchaeota archaeon]
MPIYEYECECGNKTEAFFHIADSPDAIECEKCGKKMKKVISLTAFSLKGDGWYKDGYSPADKAKGSKNKGT